MSCRRISCSYSRQSWRERGEEECVVVVVAAAAATAVVVSLLCGRARTSMKKVPTRMVKSLGWPLASCAVGGMLNPAVAMGLRVSVTSPSSTSAASSRCPSRGVGPTCDRCCSSFPLRPSFLLCLLFGASHMCGNCSSYTSTKASANGTSTAIFSSADRTMSENASSKGVHKACKRCPVASALNSYSTVGGVDSSTPLSPWLGGLVSLLLVEVVFAADRCEVSSFLPAVLGCLGDRSWERNSMVLDVGWSG